MHPRICLLHANQPEAVYVYVNIRNIVRMPPRHRQVRLHSSFVVFYFVFVL